MTRYIDVFWEKLKQQTKKRRRAISIMLVLSLVVSSTVVWSLHGTGITMVNEELCGLELHSHTDECYSDVLVCGLDEADGHTHTAECYERQLTCTLPEHIHTSDCYIGMKPDQSAKSAEEPLGDAEAIGAEIVGDENIMKMSSETDNADGDEKLSDDEEIVDADLSEFEMSPDTVQLLATPPVLTEFPDTRKQGITINLFDYGTEVLDTNQNGFNNPKYEGINAGRDIDEDILFFPYGTPESGGNPGKNHYSGDYNANPPISGNRPVQGIVNRLLSNGYPTVAGSDHSLDYLFSPTSNGDTKKVYKNVGNLLRMTEDGYYHYSSNENYAYYDTKQGDNGNFTIYDRTFGIKDRDMKIGFFPFNKYDDKKNEPNFNAKDPYYNHHFGMTLEADFRIPNEVGHRYMGEDIIFQYSGDDDMWVFVDGVLVLDVGGIHEPAEGRINFSTGEICVQDEVYGTSGVDGIKWLYTTIQDEFAAAGKTWNYADFHHIQMFYLERGGCYSNLSMTFNIPTIKTITVSKQVDKGTKYTNDFDNHEYSFKLYSKTSLESNDDELYTGSYDYMGQYMELGSDGIFKMKDGERISFHGLDQDKCYYVKEVNINSSQFSDVSINGDIEPLNGSDEIKSDERALTDNLDYDFVNKVAEEKTNINVTKQWEDNTAQNHSNDKVLFRIIRTDENGTKKEMVINGRKTFALNQDNNWSKTFNNMVTRYGSHTYSYEVKEVSVHDGYVASYQTNTLSDGTVQYIIKNVSTSKVEINVKKQWLDAFGNELTEHPASIKAKLERDYVEYGNPQSASLTVNVFNGNDTTPLISKSTSAVYVGGSIEFSVNMPDNSKFISVSSQKCSVDEFDGIFEVSEIKKDAVVNVVVNVKYDIAHPNFINLDSFDGDSPWGGRNANTRIVDNVSHTSGKSLCVTGRQAEWSGAILSLGNYYKKGSVHNFYIYAKAADNNTHTFKFTYIYKNKGNDVYVELGSQTASNGEWVKLSAENMEIIEENGSIYVESTEGKFDFYVDDFIEAQLGWGVETINGVLTSVPMSGNDLANIMFFEDTVIAPPVEIKRSSSPEKVEEFELNSDNNWSKRWTTSQLNEASNRKYVYKVTEITDNFEYLVTYENNEVSSNTADTPIIIKNTENMYELPATGGIGTKRIVFGGTFLILISLLSGYCVAKRERRKE